MTGEVTARPRCTSCGAYIWWAVHEATGKRTPIDWYPRADGNLVRVGAAGDGTPVVRVVRRDLTAQPSLPGLEFAVDDDTPRWLSHFVTCANAPQHRRGADKPAVVDTRPREGLADVIRFPAGRR